MISVDLTKWKEEYPVPLKGSQGNKYYEIWYDVRMELHGRNLKVSLVYPPGKEMRSSLEICIAASFTPGTEWKQSFLVYEMYVRTDLSLILPSETFVQVEDLFSLYCAYHHPWRHNVLWTLYTYLFHLRFQIQYWPRTILSPRLPRYEYILLETNNLYLNGISLITIDSLVKFTLSYSSSDEMIIGEDGLPPNGQPRRRSKASSFSIQHSIDFDFDRFSQSWVNRTGLLRCRNPSTKGWSGQNWKVLK